MSLTSLKDYLGFSWALVLQLDKKFGAVAEDPKAEKLRMDPAPSSFVRASNLHFIC